MPDRKATEDLREGARRTRENLLEVARVVFAEQGADASLRDVARQAGVGIGTLYRHFPNRVVLLEAVIGDRIAALSDLTDKLMTEPSPRQALTVWLYRFSATFGAFRGLSDQMLCGLSDKESDLHRSAQELHTAAGRLLNRAQAAGEVSTDVTAADLVTMAAAAGWVCQAIGENQSLRMLEVLIQGLTNEVSAGSVP